MKKCLIGVISLIMVFGVSCFVTAADSGFTFPENWIKAPTASEMGVSDYNQAPMLDEAVKNGELPPVEERLPEDPLVITPYEKVGEYGGTLTSAVNGPADWGDSFWGRVKYLFRPDPSTTEVIPSVAKGYKLSDDGKVLTIYLREGLKWSDGHLFTTEDIMFWYEDEVINEDISAWWESGAYIDGKLAKFEAVDDYTLNIYPQDPITLTKAKGYLNFNNTQDGFFFDPKHYLKKYHKKYNPDVDKLAEEEGFESWPQMFKYHKNINPNQQDINLPVLHPWVLESRNQTEKVFVRNPYYWAVDSEGNQLPYIDKFVAKIYTDQQVAILDVMSGDIDYAGRILQPSGLPMYMKNQEKGNYRVLPWKNTKSAKVAFTFNLNNPDPAKAEIYQKKEFRQAMSVAINRDEINDFVFLGLGTPQQASLDQSTSFYKEEWGKAYAEYNPEKAKQMLDKIGLKDTDGDGWRERPDGEDLVVKMLVVTGADIGASGSKVAELVSEYWEAVGVKTNLKPASTELYENQQRAGTLDIDIFPTEMTLETRAYSGGGGVGMFAVDWGYWYAYQQWVKNGMKGPEPESKGIEPPEEYKKYYELQTAWRNAKEEEEYIRLGQELYDWVAEYVPSIGTVGRTPTPVIFQNNVKNVPEKLPFTFETLLWTQAYQEQWYIEQ